jgi:TPR repeat protein
MRRFTFLVGMLACFLATGTVHAIPTPHQQVSIQHYFSRWYQQAQTTVQTGNLTEGISLLTALANKGHAASAYTLGQLSRLEQHNLPKACYWYNIAATKHLLRGQQALANCYLTNNKTLPIAPQEALAVLKQANQQEATTPEALWAEATLSLQQANQQPTGQTLAAWSTLAHRGDLQAKTNLGYYRLFVSQANAYQTAATSWLKEGAWQGLPLAQAHWGTWLLKQHWQHPEKLPEALQWLNKAHQANIPWATYQLGAYYYAKRYTAPNAPTLAFNYLNKSAQAGIPQSVGLLQGLRPLLTTSSQQQLVEQLTLATKPASKPSVPYYTPLPTLWQPTIWML